LGCTIFAVIGGFLAYFHVIAHVIGNCALAMICAAITASRLIVDTGDISMTIASILTVIALNVGVPFGIHSLVHSLRIDLRNSDRDPLTGLLNRRSVYNAVHEIAVAQQGSVGVRLNVTMIDLDQFKKLMTPGGMLSVMRLWSASVPCSGRTAVARQSSGGWAVRSS
jgi:predicted signal transduction protein with EAL and GGDEF domain